MVNTPQFDEAREHREAIFFTLNQQHKCVRN